ncbi:phosphonate ABC transporter, permease protein PhnE [uncultured Roseibium sp.]|uniref:phosphonate ABC transporter, permease protein PhnE n=1 Tax=uncultured Roseibium sp. TaxID=1936171 RepID=UPI0026366148|nr:phosphonate ABC transporter, permease protein PhnE [uncultured Roseibium sp.]
MTTDTLEPVVNLGDVWQKVRRRAWITVLAPLAVVAYLVYTWFAFDVSDLLSRAQPERAAILATDSVAYKVHVTKDFRRGEMEVAIEGERTATYDNAELPDWVTLDGKNAFVDLGDGYTVEIKGNTAYFDVPGYGMIETTATKKGVETILPEGEVPDWLKDDPRKLDARPSLDKRLQVTKTKIEIHNYFGGWENFWFPFRSPLHGQSFSQLYALALSADRLDPDYSNLWFIVHEFLGNPDWQHGDVFVALFETIMMAVLGTLTAALFGLPLAFLAARNFTPSQVLRFGTRRLFDFLRGIDMLIWSLIFIRAFGLGPLTGALAIAFTDTGSLGKLFSEALENIDNRQVEGVKATGASQIQRYRFGVIPQILPVFVSQVLYYLESNTRSATVIGALGAGGIGLLLVETMKTSRDWENTSYIIILTIVVVIAMDQTSGWLRRKLIEGRKSG